MTKVEHLLVCLMEECAEVQKEASKASRFGPHTKNIYKNEQDTHAEKIISEFGDIVAIIQLLQEEGVVPDVDLHDKIIYKKRKTVQYIERRLKEGV